MSLENQQTVSAQVVLRSASGRRVGGEAAITAETIREFAPSQDTVARATEAFAAMGFKVGPMIGISFSITAPVDAFEKVLRTRLRLAERGGVEAVEEDGSGSYELPLDSLPEQIADLVETVTFTPPPDFGPTEF